MDLLQIRNFARGRLAHRIRHTRAWRRLSRPHSHQLSFRIRVESERGESTLVASDGRAKVEPVNHLLHSMFNQIDVYFKEARYQITPLARTLRCC